MARLHGVTPNTPMRSMIGPGVALLNPNESLLSPAAWDAAAQDAFINSGTLLGATDGGWSFDYAPEYQEHTWAGVPGNMRGGRRMTSAAVNVSGSLTEFTEDNLKRFMPGSTSSVWQTSGTTPVRIGSILQHKGVLLDANYINSLCIIGERQGQKIGGIFFIYNAMNTEGFSLGLDGGEDRSATDMTFSGTYGNASFDSATGGWTVPFKIYLSDSSTAV